MPAGTASAGSSHCWIRCFRSTIHCFQIPLVLLPKKAFAFQIRQLIEQLEFLEGQVAELEEQISSLLKQTGSYITTIPGIGDTLGAIILSEIGDIHRFDAPNMFVQKIPMDDIYVMDDIYPHVAKLVRNRRGMPSSPKTVSRRIERLANLCWDTLVSRNLVLQYLGAPLENIRAPRDMIFYLAFYLYLDTPFFIAIRKQPALLF